MAILSVTTVSILILLSCALFITLKPQRGFSSDTLLRRLLEMPSSPALAARREPQHLTVTGAYIAPHYDPFVDKAIREAHKCGVVDVNTGFFRRVKTMIFVDPMFVDLFLNWYVVRSAREAITLVITFYPCAILHCSITNIYKRKAIAFYHSLCTGPNCLLFFYVCC